MTEGRRFKTRALGVDEILRRYDGVIDDADEVLKESHISCTLDPPDLIDSLDPYLKWGEHSDPLPPDDLTEVPDLYIGKLFSYISGWTNYVASQVTRSKQILDQQEKQLKVIYSGLYITFKDDGIPATDVKHHIHINDDYSRVDKAADSIRKVYETAKSREDQYRRTLNNISREQTRRANELERILHVDRGGKEKTPFKPTRRFGR